MARRPARRRRRPAGARARATERRRIAIGAGVVAVVLAGAVGATVVEDVEDIPARMVTAYQGAVDQLPEHAPGCQGLRWEVLAGIGRVESGHAAGSRIGADGVARPAILGPRLDGSGAGGNVTPVRDSDGGHWDGDSEYDRAVGPMQFIPTSWELYGRDGNGDGVADPHQVDDAALAAAVHLCGNGSRDLSEESALRAALLGYNRSEAYVDDVLRHAERYARQAEDGDSAE